ncbi:TOBE domain-containing protein [Sanguibacter sp. A247]|uniref:TOBE domain-containing protein n=1 Tax=unclassified Sanguibacter TaxID=2645534 RepID=UPI003FD7A291
MSVLRTSEAARLLGVSDDTVRRWIDAGRLPAQRSETGRWTVDGADLATFARDLADAPDGGDGTVSARNRLDGIVTRVVRDTVMAQVEVQAGPFRIVSLVSREAADELALAPGSLVSARVKATSVMIDSLEPGR